MVAAAATLGLDHVRLLRWRAAFDRLDDTKPGPGEALHALLAWERDARMIGVVPMTSTP